MQRRGQVLGAIRLASYDRSCVVAGQCMMFERAAVKLSDVLASGQTPHLVLQDFIRDAGLRRLNFGSETETPIAGGGCPAVS